MEIFDIKILNKKKFVINKEEIELYDLSDITFSFKNVNYLAHIVKIDEESKIDLISYRLYGSTEYSSTIMNCNNIINFLNIKAGKILLYPPKSTLDVFKVIPENIEEVKKELSNYKPLKDKNRIKYLENNRPSANNQDNEQINLPPNINLNGKNPIRQQNGSIIISNNLTKF